MLWASGLTPHTDGNDWIVGLGDTGPSRGLDPTEDGGPLLETGSHTGTCASLGSTLGFLNCFMEVENSMPLILKGSCCKRMVTETHKCTFQRGWTSVCVTGWWTDKDMGSFGAWFWLVTFWEVREVLDLIGEEGRLWAWVFSAPQGWNPVNKNLFPSILIVESCRFKAPCGQALVCLGILWQGSYFSLVLKSFISFFF